MDLHIITYIVNYYEVKLLRELKQRAFVINHDQSFMNLNTETSKNWNHCLKEISIRILLKQFALNFCEAVVDLAFSLINYWGLLFAALRTLDSVYIRQNMKMMTGQTWVTTLPAISFYISQTFNILVNKWSCLPTNKSEEYQACVWQSNLSLKWCICYNQQITRGILCTAN